MNMCLYHAKKSAKNSQSLRDYQILSALNREVLMKSFIESEFGYCPLIWMFHGSRLNNKINHLHELSLRIVYKDNNSSFKELLKKDNSFTVHHTVQSLAIELYRVKVNLSDTIMDDILQTRALPYNLRSNTDFARISLVMA